MNSPHVAIFTALADGHVFPVLGLCTELVKRGFRVTYAVSDNYAIRVRQTGAEPVPITCLKVAGQEDLEKSLSFLTNGYWAACAAVGYPELLLNAAVTIAQLESYYAADRPDLILYDRIAYAGRIFSKRLSCPAIQIFPHFAYFGKNIFRDKGVCVNPPPVLPFSSMLDSFLSIYGIEGDGHLWHTEAMNIYFIPKEFQYHSEYFDERSCFVGCCLDRPRTSEWEDRADARPLILISDASGCVDVDYFRAFMVALGGLDYRVILSVGQWFPVDALPPLPSNFEINRNVANLEILPSASLLVCQGGMGSTLEAIYCGVPVMALPQTPFHHEIAYRLVELGLGIALAREGLTSDMVRRNIEWMLTDLTLRERVKQMQRIFGDCGGAAMAVDIVERFLANRLSG